MRVNLIDAVLNCFIPTFTFWPRTHRVKLEYTQISKIKIYQKPWGKKEGNLPRHVFWPLDVGMVLHYPEREGGSLLLRTQDWQTWDGTGSRAARRGPERSEAGLQIWTSGPEVRRCLVHKQQPAQDRRRWVTREKCFLQLEDIISQLYP